MNSKGRPKATLLLKVIAYINKPSIKYDHRHELYSSRFGKVVQKSIKFDPI